MNKKIFKLVSLRDNALSTLRTAIREVSVAEKKQSENPEALEMFKKLVEEHQGALMQVSSWLDEGILQKWADYESQIEGLKAQVLDLDEGYDQLKQDLAEAVEDYQSEFESNKLLKEGNICATNEVLRLSKANKSLTSDLKKLETERNQLIGSSGNELIEQQAQEIEKLKTQLHNAEWAVDIKRQTIANVKLSNETLSRRIAELSKQNQQVSAGEQPPLSDPGTGVFASLADANNDLKQKNALLHDQVRELEEFIAQRDELMESIEKDNIEATGKAETQADENLLLRKQLLELESDISEKDYHIEILTLAADLKQNGKGFVMVTDEEKNQYLMMKTPCKEKAA